MTEEPEELNKLIEIPKEELDSGMYGLASCLSCGCMKPLRYRQTVEEYPFGEGYYSTNFYCEDHKPK